MSNLQTLLEKLRDLDEKAEKAPWLATKFHEIHEIVSARGGNINNPYDQFGVFEDPSAETCELVAESRNALPLLLEIIEKQREALSYQYKWMASEETEDGIYCQNSDDFEIHRNCLRHYISECDQIAAKGLA